MAGRIIEAGWWANSRRKFFSLAEVAKALVALEAVWRIDAIFDVERDITSLPAEQRLAVRTEQVAPLAADRET